MTEDRQYKVFPGGHKSSRPRSISPELAKGGLAPDAFANARQRRKKTSDPQQTTKTLHANKPTSYDVGYAKPPKERQYRPGQSGNPYGRPLGAKNKPKIDQDALSLREIILAQANREVAIQEGGKTKKIPAKEVIIRATIAAAAKGDTRAQKTVLDLVQAAEKSKQLEQAKIFEAFADYKLAWEQQIQPFREKGLDKIGHAPSRPFPDPDHIILDPIAGTVEIRGPLSRDEIPKYQFLWKQKEKTLKTIDGILEKISAGPDEVERRKLWNEFNKAAKYIRKLNVLLGDWKPDKLASEK